jgi:hypothetical protein
LSPLSLVSHAQIHISVKLPSCSFLSCELTLFQVTVLTRAYQVTVVVCDCFRPLVNSLLKRPGTPLAIGTVCFNNGIDYTVSCIDAYGTTAPPYPSTTSGLVPSATLVANDDPKIVYGRPKSWSSSNTTPGCALSPSLRVTSTINSTISFNYSGEYLLSSTTHTCKL